VQVKVSAGTKSSNTLLERVLALDRSDESVSDQIKEACRLVGVNFDDSYVTHGADPGKSYISQQQHLDEWTLRWLLKRMLSEEIQLDSPCLNYLAWLLLDVLTSRLSTRKVAILFDAHNFCTGLQKTLQWLLEYLLRTSHYNHSLRLAIDVRAQALLHWLIRMNPQGSVKEALQRQSRRARRWRRRTFQDYKAQLDE
jgi:hypothetical protein